MDVKLESTLKLPPQHFASLRSWVSVLCYSAKDEYSQKRLNLMATDESENWYMAIANRVLAFKFNQPISFEAAHTFLHPIPTDARYDQATDVLPSPINAIRYGKLAGDSVLAAVDDAGFILIWSTTDWQRPPVYFNNDQVSTWSLALHPSRPWIAVGGNDHKVKLWEISAGRSTSLRLYSFHDHMHNVPSVDFSPCGQYLASCSVDGFYCLWDVDKKQLLHRERISQAPLMDPMFWGWSVRFMDTSDWHTYAAVPANIHSDRCISDIHPHMTISDQIAFLMASTAGNPDVVRYRQSDDVTPAYEEEFGSSTESGDFYDYPDEEAEDMLLDAELAMEHRAMMEFIHGEQERDSQAFYGELSSDEAYDHDLVFSVTQPELGVIGESMSEDSIGDDEEVVDQAWRQAMVNTNDMSRVEDYMDMLEEMYEQELGDHGWTDDEESESHAFSEATREEVDDNSPTFVRTAEDDMRSARSGTPFNHHGLQHPSNNETSRSPEEEADHYSSDLPSSLRSFADCHSELESEWLYSDADHCPSEDQFVSAESNLPSPPPTTTPTTSLRPTYTRQPSTPILLCSTCTDLHLFDPLSSPHDTSSGRVSYLRDAVHPPPSVVRSMLHGISESILKRIEYILAETTPNHRLAFSLPLTCPVVPQKAAPHWPDHMLFVNQQGQGVVVRGVRCGDSGFKVVPIAWLRSPHAHMIGVCCRPVYADRSVLAKWEVLVVFHNGDCKLFSLHKSEDGCGVAPGLF